MFKMFPQIPGVENTYLSKSGVVIFKSPLRLFYFVYTGG